MTYKKHKTDVDFLAEIPEPDSPDWSEEERAAQAKWFESLEAEALESGELTEEDGAITPEPRVSPVETTAEFTLPEGWQIRGFQDALNSNQEKPPWVIQDLLMEQSATLVSAHPHSMKSLSLLYACLEAIVTKKVWGYFDASEVRNTLFIETEDPAWLVESRIRGFAQGLGLNEDDPVPGFHYVCPGPFDLLAEQDTIRELIRKHNLDFIVLSTLQNIIIGRDWKSQQDMQPIMSATIRLARECPIFLITHSPWDKRQRRAAGTVTQTANFLTTMHYEKAKPQKPGETSTLHTHGQVPVFPRTALAPSSQVIPRRHVSLANWTPSQGCGKLQRA